MPAYCDNTTGAPAAMQGSTGRAPPLITSQGMDAAVTAVPPNPAVKTRMTELGSGIFTSSPTEFGKLIADDTEKWASVVKHAGLKAD